jgi:hypothetical protein
MPCSTPPGDIRTVQVMFTTPASNFCMAIVLNNGENLEE